MSAPFLEEHLRTLHLPTVLQNYKRLAQGDDARIKLDPSVKLQSRRDYTKEDATEQEDYD
jgi:hypothetical protein